MGRRPKETCGQAKGFGVDEAGVFGGCKNAATDYHSCPYKAELYDDGDSECACCSDCTHECAMDV